MTDRELDALVAEKVFNQKYKVAIWEMPYYSRDIAAAWEVVEKIIELYPDLPFGVEYSFCGTSEGYKWYAELNPEPDFGPKYMADTAPKAICLAALKAVGVEV